MQSDTANLAWLTKLRLACEAEAGKAAERNYEVGYGKPPVHSRFRPGVSGNPRGRPVGSQNASTFAKHLSALAYQEIDAEEEALIASWEPPPKKTPRKRKRRR